MSNLLLEDADADKLQKWQDDVKKAHPDVADKLKFKSKNEKDSKGNMKDLVCAEVPGQDRCYGVFDLDTMTGEVLKEEQHTEHSSREIVHSLIRGDVEKAQQALAAVLSDKFRSRL